MLGRFIQADTIVPEPSNPQALNRYSYVYNNPIRYSDPTGHAPCRLWCEGDVISEKDIDFGAALSPLTDYNTDPADTSQLFDHILLGGEIIVAVACEACDWGFTLYHWSQGDFHPVDIVGLMPLIPSSSVRVWRHLDEVGDLGAALRGCSFSFDTLVTTTEGLKPISEVEIGDLVLAYDEQLGEVGIYPVTAVWSHFDPVVVKLVIDGELILTTPEHPFFISANAWVAAGELWLGAQVQKADGSYGAVLVIQILERPQQMYNLTVDEAHTYFVGDEQWLVHNACRAEIAKNAVWYRPKHAGKHANTARAANRADVMRMARENITGNSVEFTYWHNGKDERLAYYNPETQFITILSPDGSTVHSHHRIDRPKRLRDSPEYQHSNFDSQYNDWLWNGIR